MSPSALYLVGSDITCSHAAQRPVLRKMGSGESRPGKVSLCGDTSSKASESPAEPKGKRPPVLVDGVTLNGPTLDIREAESFLREAMPIIMEEAVWKATDVKEKVCEWRSPEQLKDLLDLELREGGEAHPQILQRCRDAIRYSVKTGHPLFFNQLYAGMDPYSLVGRFITEAINPSLYTYEVAPVFLLTEEAVLKKMIEIIGWQEGGDGIFSPGGSVSNMYAVNVARYHHCPDVKVLGLSALPRLVMFTSQECHYSVSKAAAFLGIGTNNVYVIPSDKRGKMIPAEFEKQVQRAKDEGALPFMVNATAGTTVLGAFDPLEEIADICERHNLWMHVDACWGGGALMSKKHRYLLQGIHRANSVAWNPHKMLMAGLQCCAFMVRDKTNLLQRCHSAQASYLFQQDKFYDVSYDTGDKSIQCSRKPDAFKFWLMWKAIGTKGLEERVDRALAMARYLAEEIKKRDGFRLVMEPEYTNVCFWYIPPSLRDTADGPEFWRKVHAVAPVVKERMMKKGSMMVGYQPHGDKANFFRQIIISPQVSREDMDFLLDQIHSLGMDL
ncbi:acidic amino acid decarboxylase GADL1 isoform X1 [Salmo salar]|uniref:Acidic amino acid decarboxylase GADL1 isoform X1 n=1 Tax=Salmo salar TaxID=8030 RepID=A0ABM3D055_SALSA|nr:acidic amino acid decarboxylase GADL1 isoform X1 [Salmo salar]